MTKRATIFLTGGTGMVGSNIQEHPKFFQAEDGIRDGYK